MTRTLLLLFLLLHCTASMPLSAQEAKATIAETTLPAPKKPKGFLQFLRNVTHTDTTYIVPQQYNACAMMMGDKRFSIYRLQAKQEDGTVRELRFEPSSPFRVGPYVGFSLMFLGYTFDVGATQQSLNRSNIYLSVYSRYLGIDYYYESDIHNYQLKSVKGFSSDAANSVRNVPFSGMSTYMQNIHFYYLFNHRHFSYPAAYAQSTMQKRSSGSFILGFNYTHEKIYFDYTKLPVVLLLDAQNNGLSSENLQVSNVRYRDYSLSLGYGYNWAFAKYCLANVTLTPTVGYNFSKGERFNAKEYLFDLDALNFDFISRGSVVWNNSKYFAGLSVVAHTYSYKKPTFAIHNALITASIYTGFNFWKKKKYRHADKPAAR